MSSPSAATSQRRVLCGVGSNFNGQLGLGLTLPRKEPFAPVPLGSSAADREVLEQCVDVQCGSQFTAVLDANGQTFFCGILNGQVHPKLTPVPFRFPLRCVQLACGRKHLLSLAENGCVFSWGTGYFGQLGHGDDASLDAPRMVAALEPARLGTRVVRVACGASHSGAITENDMIFMWGLNRNGQVGVDVKYESVPSPSPIDLSELASAGGGAGGGRLDAVDLRCGRGHSTALTKEGRLFTWGATSFGRLGFMDGRRKTVKPTEVQFFRSRPVKALAVGDFHSIALCRNGELYSWGYGIEGQCGLGTATIVKAPRQIEYLGPEVQIKEVACGATWSMAVTEGGRLYAWGYGDGGWLGMPPPAPPHLTAWEQEHLEEVAPYVDASSDEPSTETGMLHTRAFDSQHNVMLPCPVHIPAAVASASSSPSLAEAAEAKEGPAFTEEAFVLGVRCGAAHTVLLLSPKLRRRLERRVVHGAAEAVDSRLAVKATARVDRSVAGARVATTTTAIAASTTASRGAAGQAVYVDEEDRYLRASMVSMGAWRLEAVLAAGSSGGRSALPPPTVPASGGAAVSSSFLSSQSSFGSISSSSSSSNLLLETLSDEQLMNVVFSWCRHKKLNELSYAFIKRKLPVNMVDSAGNTPLIVACQNGHMAVCQLLVEQLGADVNCRNAKGNTPLHFSFAYGFQDSIGKYLIARGADEFATNEDGLTCYEGLSSADIESL